MFNERFEKDVEYEICVPPYGINYQDMSPTDVKNNFEWFVRVLPRRIEYLTAYCAKDLNISSSIFDFSPQSLIPLWKWFVGIAHIEETPKEELRIMYKHFSHLGESFINKRRLSVNTEFIVQDIGMYLGEIFVRKYSHIEWNYYLTPKKDFFVNRPLLVGFVDRRFNPPFNTVFEPIHMVGVQASKLLNNTVDELDLYNLFNKWSQLA